MKKEKKISIRVDPDMLDDFDNIVGPGNRSRKIHSLMDKVVKRNQKKENL